MQEIWKDIEGFEGIYQVSNKGNVKRLANSCNTAHEDRLMKLTDNGTGYLKVILTSNNKRYQYLVHRLVAKAFIDNPNEYPMVNHKDENKKNNNAENLEWCTKSYNAIYYLNYDPQRKIEYGKRFKSKSPMIKHIPKSHFEKIVQKDKKGNIIEVHENITQASIKTHLPYGDIINACKRHKNNKTRTHFSHGFAWEFLID